MKLIELNPRWVGYGGEGVTDSKGNPIPRREGVALSCKCPCGKCTVPMTLMLENPLDGGSTVEPVHAKWKRTGDNFENLTLTPSIQRQTECHWHGYITNGQIK